MNQNIKRSLLLAPLLAFGFLQVVHAESVLDPSQINQQIKKITQPIVAQDSFLSDLEIRIDPKHFDVEKLQARLTMRATVSEAVWAPGEQSAMAVEIASSLRDAEVSGENHQFQLNASLRVETPAVPMFRTVVRAWIANKERYHYEDNKAIFEALTELSQVQSMDAVDSGVQKVIGILDEDDRKWFDQVRIEREKNASGELTKVSWIYTTSTSVGFFDVFVDSVRIDLIEGAWNASVQLSSPMSIRRVQETVASMTAGFLAVQQAAEYELRDIRKMANSYVAYAKKFFQGNFSDHY